MRRFGLGLLFAALLTAAVPAGEPSPLEDAAAFWKLGGMQEASGRQQPFTSEGRGMRLGVPLEGPEREASLARGGDGRVALFDGASWLSLRPESASGPLPSADAMTVYLRLRASKPGGLIRTSLFSLVLHESGIAVGVLGVEDAAGRMYREVPFSPLSLNEWHDVIVRYGRGSLDFVVDGRLMNAVTLSEKPAVLAPAPLLLGAWRNENVPLPGFPDSVVAFLFERVFTGAMDHAAVWNRALSDGEIARLSGVRTLGSPVKPSEAQRCLEAYRAFHAASRSGNVAECERLGLSMRAFMARDRRRPIYHLTAPSDAILDPAGSFFHKGKYHVFSYRNMVSLLAYTPLAHFVSDDLVHWRDQPIAVWPDSGLDVNGIWLGNLLYDDSGTPAMMYTGLGTQGKFGILARSFDDLVSFTGKQAVMTNMVHHDGHTWKDGDTWYSITTRQYWGRRAGDLGDGIVLLTSPDLTHWTEQGEIFSARKHPAPRSDQQRHGFAEYPYLLRFGDKHALMLGTRPARYWIGRFEPSIPAFIPDEAGGKLVDHLNPFHCFNPSTIDNKGPGGSPRRIVEAMHLYASGKADGIPWSGVHVLPRVLSREGGRLTQEPVPEVASLRGKHFRKGPTLIPAGAAGLLPGVRGDALEILAEFDPGTATRFGLKVRASAGGKTGTKIFIDTATGQFGADGGLKIPSPYPELGHGPAHLTPGQPVRMRVFLDRSLIEIFVNGETGSGVFSADPAAVDLDLFSEGGDARLVALDIWEMNAAWPAPD